MIKWVVYGLLLAGPNDPGFVSVFNCHVADTKAECQLERQDLENHYYNERQGTGIISPCVPVNTKAVDIHKLCSNLKERLGQDQIK